MVTVGGPLLTQKSPTYAYIGQTAEVGDRVSDFGVSGGPPVFSVVPTDLKNGEDFIVKLFQSDFPKHENSPTVCA